MALLLHSDLLNSSTKFWEHGPHGKGPGLYKLGDTFCVGYIFHFTAFIDSCNQGILKAVLIRCRDCEGRQEYGKGSEVDQEEREVDGGPKEQREERTKQSRRRGEAN